MKHKTDQEIEEFFNELCPAKNYNHQTIEVKHNKNYIKVGVERMYDYALLSFSILKRIAEFFDTEYVNVSIAGCDTCDYNSIYRLTFIIGLK